MLMKTIAAVTLSIMSAGSAVAGQSGIPIYTTHMYSDASNTVEVGTITGQCSYRPGQGYYVQYAQTGTYTYYQVDELVGYCPDEPL